MPEAVCEIRSKNVDSLSLLAEKIEEAVRTHFVSYGIQPKKRKIWVVTWSYFKVERLPEKEETIIIKSWQNKKRGMLYPRKSSVYTKNGERIVDCAQYFVQCDAKSRKIDVRDNEMDKISCIEMIDEPQIPSFQVEFSEQLTKKMIRTVKRKYIDINGHMNNTIYIKWLEDLLVSENLNFKLLKNLWIQYEKELMVDAMVEIQYCIYAKKVYVCGMRNKKEYFRCVAELFA